MRKLSEKELGRFSFDQMLMFNPSPDPFVTVMYSIDIGPGHELARAETRRIGKKITLTSVLNKMLALAIKENPHYNQVVLDGRIYQLEDIHISNTHLIPGHDQAVMSLVFENPHLKSLEEIQDELGVLKKRKESQYVSKDSSLTRFLLRLCLRLRLYKCFSEKFAFSVGYRKGLTSNILLSNHAYGGPSNFVVLKPLISPMKVHLRIHACLSMDQLYIREGKLAEKEVMRLTVTTDHRTVHGIHGYKFGQSLERIAASPEAYLL